MIDFHANRRFDSPHESAGHHQGSSRSLKAAIAGPEQPIGKREIPGSNKFRQSLAQWNETERPLPEVTLPSLFEAQVVRSPGASERFLSTHSENHLESIMNVYKNNIVLASKFVPRDFDGDVVLFSASRSAREFAHKKWTTHIEAGSKCYEIACEHSDMLEPGPLSEIALLLSLELRQRTKSREGFW